MRFAHFQTLVIDPRYGCPQSAQLFFYFFVTAFDLLDVVNGARASGAQGRQYHRHPGSDVGAGNARRVGEQAAWPLHQYAVRVAQDNPRSHERQMIDKEKPALIHPGMQEYTADRLAADPARNAQPLRWEPGPR